MSLVRAWLYGVRGFVVMTISLAIAFSWAVTGPPTNTEIDLVSDAVATKAEAFGEEVEAAATQLCPNLPEELRMLCGGAHAPVPAEEAPVEMPPKPPPRVELAAADVEATPAPRASESQLLGGPAPRARAERAQSSRRTTPQRVTQSRRTVQRVQPQQRAAAQRPAQAQQQVVRRQAPLASRQPEATPTVSHNEDAERLQADMERAVDNFRREADERRYREQEEAEHEDWRQERRERREQRRRWEREREYEASADEGYYEEDPYPEEEAYPDDVW